MVFYKFTAKFIKEESERRVKEQNLLYAALAHDLKTPMTSVQGFAKALSDGKIRPEEQQEIFNIIYRKSNSMNDMVNTLFDYAKLGTDGYKPVFTEIDVCAFVRDIIAENYCDFENHDIELDIDIPDHAIMINADKTELKRAVTNLIVNVYKHNPDGIRAKVSVYKDNNKAEIKIADSGEPLPKGMDIFEPFMTENTARTVGHGTGLGLAVTKRVIERHGGEIGVKTTVPDYTKMFFIRL
ncbi:MAG: HAMP domain-containing sensor histidine kinase [Oscillospiraceae bacterium]